MKKIFIGLIVFVLIILVIGAFLLSKIRVDITQDDLPQDVYTNSGDPSQIAQTTLVEFLNPLSTKDEYTLTEEFLNYMLLDSIRKNINEEYDPLNEDCIVSECDVIVDTEYGNVEYAYVELNEDNQIVATINFNRDSFPKVETAVYLIFDVDVNLTELEINLELDTIFLNETEITTDNLDFILGYFNSEEIENMITIGKLDLDTYRYTVSLLFE